MGSCTPPEIREVAIAAALIVVAWCVAGRGYALLFDTPRGLFPNSLMSTGQALGPRAAAAEAPASLSRGVRAEPQAQARRHRPRKKGMSASGEMPRLMGMRSAAMRLAEMPPPTAATHATNHPPTTPRGSPGRNSWPGWARSFLFACPWVWWRHPTQRRPPAGAGFLRTGGSQAGEGQEGFAREKSAPGTSQRTTPR